MPGKKYLGHGLRLNILFDECFQQLIADNSRFVLWIEFLFLQIIAVFAGQITEGAGWFEHYVEGSGKGGYGGHGLPTEMWPVVWIWVFDVVLAGPLFEFLFELSNNLRMLGSHIIILCTVVLNVI